MMLSRNRLLLILLFSMLAISSFMVSVGAMSQSYVAQAGANYAVTDAFAVTGHGFEIVQASATASPLPASWSNGGTVQTALTPGNWFYQVNLTIAASAQTNHTYTLKVQWDTGNGFTTLGTLTVTTGSSITAGEKMIFQFDTGETSFSAPAAITMTVA